MAEHRDLVAKRSLIAFDVGCLQQAVLGYY
jgi:hypothetical protein